MANNNDLLDQAEQEGVEIVYADLPASESVSVMTRTGSCYIGLNKEYATSADERVHLAHELGHCMTGSFYNPYSPLDIREKHEYRADRWAIQRLMPQDQVIDAVKHGITEVWELAELFGVTEQLARNTIESYKEQGFDYDN